MGFGNRCLVWALVGAHGVIGCGGRAEERGLELETAGTPNRGAQSNAAGYSAAGAPPTVIDPVESAGAPPVAGGAPNYAGSPSYAGGPPIGGGAPSYAGAPLTVAGAPSYAGGPPAAAGAPNDEPWEVQQLARIRAGIVGNWTGEVTNPWNSPCKVKMTFTADGYYSAHSQDDNNCIVLYYGSNQDSPEKTYLIDDVTAAAEGVGMLEIWFSPGDTNEGAMKAISLTPDNGTLRFRVYKGEYGPMVFTLFRT